MDRKATLILCAVVAFMAFFLLLAQPVMMDDGFQYEGFTESLARGKLDFASFYGFQGLSFFAVPIYWLTNSPISIIITSMIFCILSIPLAYGIGKWPAVILFLLTPYPYMTMMRGFQEAALMFFVLLVIYAAKRKKPWAGLAWGAGAIVKPFALVLAPLFLRRSMKKFEIWCLVLGACVGIAYMVLNYAQTGHVVTLAATGAYAGVFDPGNVPALEKSFTLDWRTWARVGANLFVSSRKIMTAPALIIIGAWSLWQTRRETWSRRVIAALLLNILMVGPITYAFPKYLLPMAVLFGLAATPILRKRPLLWVIVLFDSAWVFAANYSYFGKAFWHPSVFAWMPFLLASVLCVYEIANHYSHAQRA
ncbi:MAG: hypothetical protein AAB483_01580 [Patescibacteria group bacterium]